VGVAPRREPEDIQAAFTEWELVDDVAMELLSGAPRYVHRVDERVHLDDVVAYCKVLALFLRGTVRAPSRREAHQPSGGRASPYRSP
jgi:hypothetical protein